MKLHSHAAVKAKAWLIPFVGRHVGVWVKLWKPLQCVPFLQCFWEGFQQRGSITCVCTSSFAFLKKQQHIALRLQDTWAGFAVGLAIEQASVLSVETVWKRCLVAKQLYTKATTINQCNIQLSCMFMAKIECAKVHSRSILSYVFSCIYASWKSI